MARRGRNGNRPGFDPIYNEFVNPNRNWRQPHPAAGFQSSWQGNVAGHQLYHDPRNTSAGPPPHPTTPVFQQTQSESVSVDNQSLLGMINELRNAWLELRGENILLKQTVNAQAHQIARLDKELDELNQYGRRENVCFTNLLVDESHTAETQVINLCHELGVEVTPDDLVASHPLPARKGKAVRVIARFKERSMAQKVFANRKQTKNIDSTKKGGLAARADKGFAVQPNITPRRAKLLAQVKDAAQQMNWNSVWVDYRTGNIMLKQSSSCRPVQIHSTLDLRKLIGPNFTPYDYYFCVRDTSEVIFTPTKSGEVFSPVAPPHQQDTGIGND